MKCELCGSLSLTMNVEFEDGDIKKCCSGCMMGLAREALLKEEKKASIERGLEQKGTVSRGSFAKYAGDNT